MHFSRSNRNAAWILPFPNNPRTNPDEMLRPMSRTQVKQLEAEMLAGRMMEVLEEQQTAEMVPRIDELEEKQTKAEAVSK